MMLTARQLTAAEARKAGLTKRDYDIELCRSWVRECFESADYKEGRQAFMEKRKPVFVGE